MERDPGSDLPENLGLLEHGYIETSRAKCERSSQTANTAADDCNAKRTRHLLQTLSVRSNDGRREVTDWLRLSAGSRASFRCASEFLDHRLTHRKLLDLAGHRGRELLHEPDV